MDTVMRRDDLLQWCICKCSNDVKTKLNWWHEENKSYYGQNTIYFIIKLFLWIRERQCYLSALCPHLKKVTKLRHSSFIFMHSLCKVLSCFGSKKMFEKTVIFSWRQEWVPCRYSHRNAWSKMSAKENNEAFLSMIVLTCEYLYYIHFNKLSFIYILLQLMLKLVFTLLIYNNWRWQKTKGLHVWLGARSGLQGICIVCCNWAHT